MAQPAKVGWFELPADDPARASAFYKKVFNWDTPSMGDAAFYALTIPSDKQANPTEPGSINGDISPRSKGLDRPLIMIAVDNVAEQLKEIAAAGGKTVHPPEDASAFGGPIWAVFSDTEGNHVGVYSFGAN